MIEENRLCDYGCGELAKFEFKNGKVCCSDKWIRCSKIKKRRSENMKKIMSSLETRRLLSESRKKFVGENHPLYGKPCSEERKRKISEGNKKFNKEHTPIWLGRKHTEESKLKIGKSSLGRKFSEESKKKMSERLKNGQSVYMNSFPRDPEKMKRVRKNQRERMFNGHMEVMHKAIKNPSNVELKLRELLNNLEYEIIFTHKILRYFVDAAIIKYKIAIEYDGYYHFDTEEHKEYHNFRQKRIENEGWKFIRYNIFQKFPTLEQVKKDIEEIVNETII